MTTLNLNRGEKNRKPEEKLRIKRSTCRHFTFISHLIHTYLFALKLRICHINVLHRFISMLIAIMQKISFETSTAVNIQLIIDLTEKHDRECASDEIHSSAIVSRSLNANSSKRGTFPIAIFPRARVWVCLCYCHSREEREKK